jgi:hypothetical protein
MVFITSQRQRQRDPPPPPLPLVTQPGRLSFRDWCDTYSYFITCIFNNLRHALTLSVCNGDTYAADAMFSWATMHDRLQRYLYRVSGNASRKFTLLVER